MDKKGSKNKILRIVGILCIIGMIAALVLFFSNWMRDRNEMRAQAEEQEQISQALNASAGETRTEDASDAGTTSEESTINRAVTDAREINPDVLAILEYGDNITQYVLQTDDNDYYLEHDYRKNYSESGAAFLDARCYVEPRSRQWMIHGHNMRSGAVFGELNSFLKLDYLRKYPLIYLTLESDDEVYVPYAVLDVNVDTSASNYFKITEFDFETDEEFTAFTNYYIENSYYDIPVDVTPEDELLTLSTCSYVYSDSRLLIACRKLRADETPEEMAELIAAAAKK